MTDPACSSATAKASQGVVALFPELYVNANAFQRALNLRVLDRLQGSFEGKPEASQQFIDLGCGTGDFTLRELLPRCQPCSRMVATDINKDMVRYARENFAHPQIEYEVHDISKDVSGLVAKYGKFDRVYSFFALHWAKDQMTALQNVSDLMATGGECLLLFVARWTGYELWRRMTLMDSWKSYGEICEQYIPASHDLDDHDSLVSYMTEILKNANLKTQTCDILTVARTDEDADEIIGTTTAVDPILPLLPEEYRASFREDVANVVRAFWIEKEDRGLEYYYDMFVVHASKL